MAQMAHIEEEGTQLSAGMECERHGTGQRSHPISPVTVGGRRLEIVEAEFSVAVSFFG